MELFNERADSAEIGKYNRKLDGWITLIQG